ncbi:MAG: hypothetical protein OHK0046_05110 [Anaerolineae bacterium]
MVQVQIAAFHYDSVLYPEIELGGPPGYDSVDVMLEKIAQHECYTFVNDDEIIGGAVIFVKGSGHYHLDLIFIHPQYHGQSIGTGAMRFLEGRYPATKWTLDTPQWAVRNRHFYEKLGYVIVAEYEDDGFPMVAYEKLLAPEPANE